LLARSGGGEKMAGAAGVSNGMGGRGGNWGKIRNIIVILISLHCGSRFVVGGAAHDIRGFR
jgi:hypothetical protein